MHDRGLAHRDLKAANLLVGPAGDVTFIDLVGVRARRAVSFRLRVRDLTRLNASFVNSPQLTDEDRKRFLETYLQTGLRRSPDWDVWWTAIAERTRAKVEKNARRNRPLA